LTDWQESHTVIPSIPKFSPVKTGENLGIDGVTTRERDIAVSKGYNRTSFWALGINRFLGRPAALAL